MYSLKFINALVKDYRTYGALSTSTNSWICFYRLTQAKHGNKQFIIQESRRTSLAKPREWLPRGIIDQKKKDGYPKKPTEACTFSVRSSRSAWASSCLRLHDCDPRELPASPATKEWESAIGRNDHTKQQPAALRGSSHHLMHITTWSSATLQCCSPWPARARSHMTRLAVPWAQYAPGFLLPNGCSLAGLQD